MRAKKIIGAIALAAAMGLSNIAGAAPVGDGWYFCTPQVLGPNEGKTLLDLGECQFGASRVDVDWVAIDDNGGKEMLAVFLTAMSLEKDVNVHISGTWDDASAFTYSNVVGLNMSR